MNRKEIKDKGYDDARIGLSISAFDNLKIKHTEKLRAYYEIGWRQGRKEKLESEKEVTDGN